MAFRVVCDGVARPTEFGLSGCALPFESDLSNSSITIASPFPATVSINSYETGYSERYILEPGQPRTFLLSDLVPRQTEFATYVFFANWQKPKQIKTEVPVRGQSGLFYFKLAPKGSQRAKMVWSPATEGPNGIGITYAQFRALAEVSTASKEIEREPIRLQIETTASVADGRYQLYNAPKEIGVPTSPFAGDEILIGRHSLTGPGRVDSYTLFGWARTKQVGTVSLLELDNDFVVGVNLFRYDTAKLTAELTFTDDEVCYLTETSVFMIALSGVDELHNAPDEGRGCFPIPEGTADMFFLTNVGRSAIAYIDGPNRTWQLKN
jgi:hypothetical protein